MIWASYEDFIAEVPVIVAEEPLCIACEIHLPESGADHCTACLNQLNTVQ